jgi:hypothetical protein
VPDLVEPFDACDEDIRSDLTGKVALAVRGRCNFLWKAFQVQKANAIALIVMDDKARAPDE